MFPALIVRENLEMGGFKYRRERRKVDELIERAMQAFPRLRERASQPAGTLSGGEQQMLALSRALMSEPRLLCMDEPSLGLAPIVVQDIFKSIRAVNAAGTSVLLVEQNARYALETASRGYVLQTGAIIASGPCAELKQDERVKEAYLGRDDRARQLRYFAHAARPRSSPAPAAASAAPSRSPSRRPAPGSPASTSIRRMPKRPRGSRGRAPSPSRAMSPPNPTPRRRSSARHRPSAASTYC